MAEFRTYTAIGQREDLSNTIYNIAPTETPVVSSIGKTTAKGTLHEWQTDDLSAASAAGLVEGADASGASDTPTVRLGNRTQIQGKTVHISGTLDAVDKAGRKSETAYQLAKAGQELKRDMEKTILGNVAQSAGVAGSGARLLGSIQTWLLTNYVTEATAGSPAGPVGGNGTATRTSAGSGNYLAFGEDKLKACVKSVFENGGNPTMLVVPPTQKQAVSAFTGIAAQRYQAPANKQTTIVGAADVYMSDFGTLSVVPDRFMTRDTGTGTGEQALVIDPTMLNIATLRPFQSNLLAKAGDSEKHQMLSEYTLQVNNEKAHGIVADLLVS
tara:strand:- start:1652 stop:2635 length:984 start_codon:yes stop_codon:yes gene_type:complete